MTAVDDLRSRLAASDSRDVYSALIEIGKANRSDLEPDVAAFLDHATPALRGAAIRVLGFYWKVPAFRARALEMARTATDDDERSAAILAWSGYEHGTKSPEALAGLLAILTEDEIGMQVRGAAYHALLAVGGLPAEERAKAGSGVRADRLDWALIQRVLEGTGVALPASVPVPSTSGRLGVSRVTYESGRPGGPLGKLVADFNGDTQLVTLRQQMGDTTREWMGSLPARTWEALVSSLESLGFPAAPTPADQPLSPGTTHTSLAWRRHGELHTIEFPTGTSQYQPVNKLVMPILAQLAPDAIGRIPQIWFTDDTKIETPFEVKN